MRPRAIPRPQPPSASVLADLSDQVLQLKPNELATANLVPQSPSHDAGVSTNPLANVDIADDPPISQPRSPAIETQETSSSQHQRVTSPVSLVLIPDKELEAYFNAPITHPPHTSSPVQQHLVIIEEELQKPFPLDSTISSKLE